MKNSFFMRTFFFVFVAILISEPKQIYSGQTQIYWISYVLKSIWLSGTSKDILRADFVEWTRSKYFSIR